MQSIFRGGVRPSNAELWQRCLALFCRPINEIQHAFDIPQHIAIPNSKNAITTLVQPRGASFVAEHPAFFAVLATVQFDDEFCRRTIEIHDIGTDRLLSAKTQLAKALRSQMRPQFSFDIGGVTAQRRREALLQRSPAFGRFYFGMHRRTPPRNLQTQISTLPQGEGESRLFYPPLEGHRTNSERSGEFSGRDTAVSTHPCFQSYFFTATRQIEFPVSSATSNAPSGATTTPTGRP